MEPITALCLIAICGWLVFMTRTAMKYKKEAYYKTEGLAIVHSTLKERVSSLRTRVDSALVSIDGRLNKLENPERTGPSVAEELLTSLGGRADKCYDENGKIRSVEVSAPWMKEPIKMISCVGYKCSANSMSELVDPLCKEAIKELVDRVDRVPKPKASKKK